MSIEVTCPRCGKQFEQNVGRGRKSPVCVDCRRDLAIERAAIRQFAVMSASMIEVSQLMGSQLAKMRTEVVEQQEGRCAACDKKRRRLFLQRRPDEGLTGSCVQCFMRGVYGDDATT